MTQHHPAAPIPVHEAQLRKPGPRANAIRPQAPVAAGGNLHLRRGLLEPHAAHLARVAVGEGGFDLSAAVRHLQAGGEAFLLLAIGTTADERAIPAATIGAHQQLARSGGFHDIRPREVSRIIPNSRLPL